MVHGRWDIKFKFRFMTSIDDCDDDADVGDRLVPGRWNLKWKFKLIT